MWRKEERRKSMSKVISDQKMTENGQFSSATDQFKAISDAISQEIQKTGTLSTSTKHRVRKWLKDLEAMGLAGELGSRFIDLIAIYLSTPLGQLILTIVLVYWLEDKKFLSGTTATEIVGVILSADVIGALGSSNILSQIAGLSGIIGGKS